jgi:hypothetical protein
MTVSQRLAVAAHMHVLLRRKTGRVTDTEWMAENTEYALEIVRFARAKAEEDKHPELHEWADKLERAALEPRPAARAPLVPSALQVLRERSAVPPAAPAAPAAAPDSVSASSFAPSNFGGPGFAESTFGAERPGAKPPRDPNAPRYVGGIR